MNAIAQFIFSLGFAVLYSEMASGLSVSDNAPFIGLVAFLAYLIAFYLPQPLFRFTLKDSAPIVLGQLSRRFAIAALVTLAFNTFLAGVWLPGRSDNVAIAMELYSATVLGLLVFHAMGGLMAEQANYLQRTNQYKSDQLLAVVVAMCVLFVLLAMYFLSFDLATQRPPRIYVRDMIFATLAVFGFVWFVYRLGHH